MKKTSIYFSALLAALLSVSCQEQVPEEPATIEPEVAQVSVNKRGLNIKGAAPEFDVVSNVYWTLRKPEGADWLQASPAAGFGTQAVVLEVSPNAGEARQATLTFESYEGLAATVTVSQEAASDALYYFVSDFESEFDINGIGSDEAVIYNVEVSDGKAVIPAGTEMVIGPVKPMGDSFFQLEAAPGAGVEVSLSDDGEVYLPLDMTDGKAAFFMEDPVDFFIAVKASAPVELDRLVLKEGVSGEGQEIVFKVGGDDGMEIGYVYFQDDFSWVTEVYGGTDYITYWPSASGETFWNNITAAAYGDEAYSALANSGWSLSDNRYKQRVYLRVGYIKMGRGANTSGAGGGLITPTFGIKSNKTSNIVIRFDAADFYSTSGKYDAAAVMQVRVIGDGLLENGETVQVFPLSTSLGAEWQSGKPDKAVWETFEAFVNGASPNTRIVLESVEETTANRWFLDNVVVSKASYVQKQ